jgi:protein SFI1
MLALSSLSGLSLGSSAVSQDVDLELVEEIIHRSPRSATTFPSVYRAYGEVLEEKYVQRHHVGDVEPRDVECMLIPSGLSQASDTAYYQFLLRLGVIRAPTWGERWDLWKATNTIQSRPHTSPRKSRATSDRSAAIKARLPFLASASSDLDEGFEGDGESAVGLDNRLSPRRELKGEKGKSMVGYSPSQSVDYDFTSLTAPIRTSTPVNARAKGSPPLPPYSVSDISEVSELQRSDSHRTPRTGNRQLEVKDLDADVVREMERRADEFYETGLRGRCWDVWMQASEWVQVCSRKLLRVFIRLTSTENNRTD